MTNKTISNNLPIEGELLRKLVHFVAFFALVVIYPLLNKLRLLSFLFPTSTILVLLELQRVRSNVFGNFLKRNFKVILRAEELESSIGKISIIGSTWACWSFTVITILFPIHIAVSCFAMFLMADAVAALVGKSVGTKHWTKSKKTIEGSVAFLCVGIVIMLLFPNVVFKTGAIAVLVATLAEIPEKPVNDNFRVPLIAATAMFLFERSVV